MAFKRHKCDSEKLLPCLVLISLNSCCLCTHSTWEQQIKQHEHTRTHITIHWRRLRLVCIVYLLILFVLSFRPVLLNTMLNLIFQQSAQHWQHKWMHVLFAKCLIIVHANRPVGSFDWHDSHFQWRRHGTFQIKLRQFFSQSDQNCAGNLKTVTDFENPFGNYQGDFFFFVSIRHDEFSETEIGQNQPSSHIKCSQPIPLMDYRFDESVSVFGSCIATGFCVCAVDAF